MSKRSAFSSAAAVINLYRMLTFFSIGIAVISLMFAIWWTLSVTVDANNRVYVVAPEATVAADLRGGATTTVLQYEVPNLVKSFIKNMFEFDAQSFARNIEEGGYFADPKSVGTIYESYQRNKLQEQITQRGIYITVEIDSVQFNPKEMKGRVYFVQRYYGAGQLLDQSPTRIDFGVQRQMRSATNSYGLLLTDIVFRQYTRVEATEMPLEEAQPVETPEQDKDSK